MKKVVAGFIVCMSCLCHAEPEFIVLEKDPIEILGVNCTEIKYQKSESTTAASSQDSDLKQVEDALKALSSGSKSADELWRAANKLTELSTLLPSEQQKLLDPIYLNLFIRAAAKGCVDAMYDVVSISYCPKRDELKEVVEIEGWSGDFIEIVDALQAELDKKADSEAFRRAIYTIKSHSAPTSRRNSDISPIRSWQRSYSESDLLKMKKIMLADK